MNKLEVLWNDISNLYIRSSHVEWLGFALMGVMLIWSAVTGSIFATLAGALIGLNFFVANGRDVKTRFSIITLFFIWVTACSLVGHVQPKEDYTAWVIAKIMFVAFFGLFGGHLMGLFKSVNKKVWSFMLLAALAILFAMAMKKYGWFNSPKDAGYKWNDLLEDMLLGVASLLYAVVIPPETATPAGPVVATPATPEVTSSESVTGTPNPISDTQAPQGSDNSTT